MRRDPVLVLMSFVIGLVVSSDPARTQAATTPGPGARQSARSAAALAAPFVLSAQGVKAEFRPPLGWKPVVDSTKATLTEPTPTPDRGGMLSVLVLPLQLPDTTLEHLNATVLDQGREGVTAGRLSSCEVKQVGGVDGIFMVDKPKPGTQATVRWTTHTKKRLLEVSLRMPSERAASMRPLLESVLASMKLVLPE